MHLILLNQDIVVTLGILSQHTFAVILLHYQSTYSIMFKNTIVTLFKFIFVNETRFAVGGLFFIGQVFQESTSVQHNLAFPSHVSTYLCKIQFT